MRFREEQRFEDGWRWFWAGVILGPLLLVAVVLLVVLAATGDVPTVVLVVLGIVAVFELGLLALLLRMRLTVEVGDERVAVRVAPFFNERIPADQIRAVEEIPSGLRRAHGVGFRKRRPDRVARYTVGTDAGVRLTKADGWTVVLGSRRSSELTEAIRDLTVSRGRT